MMERYIASGRMVFRGMEFGRQADYIFYLTYISPLLSNRTRYKDGHTTVAFADSFHEHPISVSVHFSHQYLLNLASKSAYLMWYFPRSRRRSVGSRNLQHAT